jgi:SAM-dependent methyltransferase
MTSAEYYAIVERRHVIQNPTSFEKLERLLDYCELADGQQVLDVGCGKGALLKRAVARAAIRAVGIELNPVFAAQARQAEGRPLEIHEMPALEFTESGFDVGFCIGASFAIGAFEEAIAWLKARTRPGARVAIGDLFARRPPLPGSVHHEYPGADRTLSATVAILESVGLELIGLIEASTDDWDRYEDLHWLAAADYLRDHPEDAAFRERVERSRRDYLENERETLGWAIFICLKR